MKDKIRTILVMFESEFCIAESESGVWLVRKLTLHGKYSGGCEKSFKDQVGHGVYSFARVHEPTT
jgi:hypothetical protein